MTNEHNFDKSLEKNMFASLFYLSSKNNLHKYFFKFWQNYVHWSFKIRFHQINHEK